MQTHLCTQSGTCSWKHKRLCLCFGCAKATMEWFIIKSLALENVVCLRYELLCKHSFGYCCCVFYDNYAHWCISDLFVSKLIRYVLGLKPNLKIQSGNWCVNNDERGRGMESNHSNSFLVIIFCYIYNNMSYLNVHYWTPIGTQGVTFNTLI